MKTKAQAALEYLMTYGWALIIIATIIGVLVFVASPTDSGTTFASSDPTKIMLKGGIISGGSSTILLQNITGGKIIILELKGLGFEECTVNGKEPTGTFISAGGEMMVECNYVDDSAENLEITYRDHSGLEKNMTLKRLNKEASPILITQCPYTLNQSGRTYLLSGNITSTEDTCLVITGENIILNCGENSITGSGSNVGIALNNAQNSEVRNCTVSAFSTGIYLGNSSNGNTIKLNTSTGNTSKGISVGGNNNTIQNNNANNNNTWGISIRNSYATGNQFIANQANNNGARGFDIVATGNIFNDNHACGNVAAQDFLCMGNNTGLGNIAKKTYHYNDCTIQYLDECD